MEHDDDKTTGQKLCGGVAGNASQPRLDVSNVDSDWLTAIVT